MSQLSAEEIHHLVRPEEMSGEQERFLEEYFHRTLYPIVTPLASIRDIRFPIWRIAHFAWSFLSATDRLAPAAHTDLSIVHIPTQVAPRFIPLPSRDGQYAFMLLETSCTSICRGSITALRLSLVTRFGLRATPISA